MYTPIKRLSSLESDVVIADASSDELSPVPASVPCAASPQCLKESVNVYHLESHKRPLQSILKVIPKKISTD